MLNAKTIALLVLAMAGCSEAPRVELPAHLDTHTLSAESESIVLRAADEWYIATGGSVDLTSGAGRAIPVVVGALPENKVGYTDLQSGDFEITLDDQDRSPAKQLKIAMHEIGHALGLPHLSQGLMKPRDGTPCIDSGALEVVCMAYGCGHAAHPTCAE